MADALENTGFNYPVWLKRPKTSGFSYKDYKNWDDEIRLELLNGLVYMMASPDVRHQIIVGELYFQLKGQLKGRKCKVFSELDCRLFYEADEYDETVVRPDIIVICDENKFKGKLNCEGPPDFVIEVMSKSSKGRDLIIKKELYEEAGVKEYWIVDEDNVHKFLLKDGLYIEDVCAFGQKLQAGVLDSVWLDFKAVAGELG